MGKTAILVDGGFYQKRAAYLFGSKTPEARVDELMSYCHRHVPNPDNLYRIFYYDCPPSEKKIFHPLTRKTVDLKKTQIYSDNISFQKLIVSKRKVALRLGELLDIGIAYTLKPEALKKLCSKVITIDQLKEDDFVLSITQKGVDMRIGLDISSLAMKKQVERIILISGDSDFVPAAKFARREGIDFVLDPMWQSIKENLQEHIDGLHACVSKPDGRHTDVLSARPGRIIGNVKPNTAQTQPSIPSQNPATALMNHKG